jgi:hypothetical protein
MLDVIANALNYLRRDKSLPDDYVRQALRLTEQEHAFLLKRAGYRRWDERDAQLYALVIEKVDHHHYIPPHHRPAEVGTERMYLDGSASSDPATLLQDIDQPQRPRYGNHLEGKQTWETQSSLMR